ncbi:N-acetylglucosaminyl-phosphatidylinositol de-N-acetylase isoform X2 [Lampris incognitus]|uniref:N-acetylglucosaminyl-phosphatidylinositol de-N-acetylase isoform X2 n=1 Tax=Lampris incognitus TaxID=2546036 RepID=UPI0024B4B066|nr:N-acetylglucosaminyl-phosphatidylinositol de-N-acetylase isoform X2 [Lampris incognitus]
MNAFLVLILVLSYFVWIKCIYRRHRRCFAKSVKYLRNSLLSTAKSSLESRADGADIRALIVAAHPDDECMFFAPTILNLVELKACVHLLCLSQGNYYNQGAERKKELVNSCAVLGIPASRVTIVDHKNLPDDPNVEWRIPLTSSLIMNHLRAHSFNMVLTFDGRGVSGHPNHIAIHKAVRLLHSLFGDCWPSQKVPLLFGAAPLLATPLTFLLHCGIRRLQACQGSHVVSSHTAPVVSPPLHLLFTLHVCQHIPDDPAGSEEPEDLLVPI